MTESDHPPNGVGGDSAGQRAIEPGGSHRAADRVVEEAMLSKPVAVALSNQNIKYQEEGTAEKLVEIADAWRAIVSQLWSDAAKAMTKGDTAPGDAGAVADEDFDDFADWLVERVDWRKAVLPRVAASDSRTGDAFDGPLELVMLKVRVGAEGLQGKPPELASFFRGAVAATLRRLEEDGMATREAQVDLVIQPLIRLAASGTPIFTGNGLCDFAAGVWDYLDREKQQRREGFFVTQLNLAQWVGQWGGKTGRERVRYYYHRLLSEGPQATGSAVVKVAANNLAGQIADDIQMRPDKYRDGNLATASRVVNRLQMLSTVARLSELDADGDANTPAAIELASGFWRALGRPQADGAAALRSAHAVMGMANVVSAWNEVDWTVVAPPPNANEGRSAGEGWQATISVHAALARVVFNLADDWDEIPSAFFNAGAALGRFDDGPMTARLRFAVNAVGLRWALERATEADQAMAAYHGVDCAVNLLGALTEIEGVIPKTVEPLAAVLLGWGTQADPAEVQVDVHRIKASLSQLHVDISRLSVIPFTPVSAGEALHALLAVQSPALAVPDITKPADPLTLAPLARELSQLFGEALGEETYRQHLDDLDALLGALARQADVPQDAWQKLYGQWHGESNPIVEAGLMTEDAWHRLARDAVRPTESLADWLSECLRDFAPP
ncbi:MAG: hypothetical protein HZB40_15875 [Rhodocyclales bacterium]|nr:hypothetical protein [Rhodocyclales bacterium]